MKVGWQLFNGLAIFYFLTAILYWQIGGEAVGITAIGLSAGLAFIVGFYLWFTDRRSGGVLPVALAMTAVGVGLIIGWWVTLIAAGILLVTTIGFVLEYDKPSNSNH